MSTAWNDSRIAIFENIKPKKTQIMLNKHTEKFKSECSFGTYYVDNEYRVYISDGYDELADMERNQYYNESWQEWENAKIPEDARKVYINDYLVKRKHEIIGGFTECVLIEDGKEIVLGQFAQIDKSIEEDLEFLKYMNSVEMWDDKVYNQQAVRILIHEYDNKIRLKKNKENYKRTPKLGVEEA